MAPEVLRTLIGRVPEMTKPAFVKQYSRHKVKGYVFPGLIPSSTTLQIDDKFGEKGRDTRDELFVCGKLLHDLSPSEESVLNWFEGDEYSMQNILVWTPTFHMDTDYDDCTLDLEEKSKWKCVTARAYIWANPIEDLNLDVNDGAWSYKLFRENHLNTYLRNTVVPCREELDKLGIGKIQKS